MKKKKTKIILIIILILFLILWMFKEKKINVQEDFIFFKLLGQGKATIFDVSYKNTKLESVNLKETIDSKTLVKEKIAPGTKGNFKIVIISNEKSSYQIIFKSKNEKPENLVFWVEGINKEFSKLEDLGQNLKGNINENETKQITVNWEWKYENGDKGNIQDTEDAKNIAKYNFDIYAIGNI